LRAFRLVYRAFTNILKPPGFVKLFSKLFFEFPETPSIQGFWGLVFLEEQKKGKDVLSLSPELII
jgi:hypothetical protein